MHARCVHLAESEQHERLMPTSLVAPLGQRRQLLLDLHFSIDAINIIKELYHEHWISIDFAPVDLYDP